MNPLGTRARVEELTRLLDGAIAGPSALTAGHTALAMRLRAVAPSLDALVVPRPDFRAALRQRLVAVATVQADAPYAEPLTRPKALDAAVSWSQSRKAQRRIGVMAGAMAGVIGFTGVGIAASRSLPGQPFYGLKRAGEGVQLQLTSGDTAKGTKHLEFAADRLREIKALAAGDPSLSLGLASTPVASGVAFGGSLADNISEALTSFDEETRSGQELLEGVYRETGKPEPLRILTSFSTQQQDVLFGLLLTLPTSVRADAEQSLELVAELGSEAGKLLALGTCGGECFPGNAGPTLPTEPVPTPGATATPTQDTNGVPPCTCTNEPTPTPAPTPVAEPQPTESASPSPSPSPTPEPTSSPTPSPSSSPGPLPTVVPVPTTSPLPTLPPLPIPLPSLLPLASLLPALPVQP